MALESEHNWKFAQCFGDKGEVEDITEGEWVFSMRNSSRLSSFSLSLLPPYTKRGERRLPEGEPHTCNNT